MSRLTSHRQFQKVYAKGRKIHDSLFQVYILFHPRDKIRFGLTVTRKIGNAVIRNRIKRIFREVIRGLAPCMAPGIDVVIVANPGIIGVSQDQVCRHLRRVFCREGVLKSH